MPDLPASVAEYHKRQPAFHSWLVANGSAILAPTNPFEVARFDAAGGVGVVFRDKNSRITSWQGGALQAWEAWRDGKAWRATKKASRGSGRVRAKIASLMARDGSQCMYCSGELTAEDATIEHVVSVTHGGPNHLANLTLACGPCNREAGHLSAREKVEMAIRKRSQCHAP